MEHEAARISDILKAKLKARKIVTNFSISPEELFDPAKVSSWIRHLLACDKLSGLDGRIDAAPPERLTHAAAAYLLGLAVRERLELNFDFLPRIFSHGAVGDSFHFFWAAICLCHDLGYQYERGDWDTDLMDTPEGRLRLLDIRHDLFALEISDLAGLGIRPGGREEAWVLASLDLAKKYDRMRRKCGEPDRTGGCVDHGVAGALMLYDILMNEYERVSPESSRRRDPSRFSAVPEGELSAHAGRRRFAACAVIIACTVARHNMWVPKASDVDRYRRYGLDALCPGGSAARVRGEDPLEQLLFLLGYMDTIDPVRGLYVRKAEGPEPRNLDRFRRALLDCVRVRFPEPPAYRWASALKYRALTISLDAAAPEDVREAFDRCAREVSGMADWLETRRPLLTAGGDGKADSVTCYYPSFPRRERVWAGGVREHEVTALCLYAGGGVGKAGFFYQCRNAYQTLNLLMMEGFDGEEVRVLQEGQRPYGLYILEWQRTLEVLTDLLNAQYKFMEYGWKQRPALLYRADRRVNFDLLRARGETFAFTSTSKEGFLQEIARPKKDLVLLNVVLTCPVPFLDYGGLLGDAYVYSDEQEILLPPFLKVLEVSEEALTEEECRRFQRPGGNPVPKYRVKLGEFAPEEPEAVESDLICWLDENCRAAAGALDHLREGLSLSAEERAVYLAWKERFQLLVRSCFGGVSKAYRR